MNLSAGNPYNPETYIVIGLDDIAKIFGVTRRTIQNWRRKEGFPIARLPSGSWALTLGNLDRWLLMRNDVDPYCRDGETPVQFEHVTRARTMATKAAMEIPHEELQAIISSAERAIEV